MLFNLRIRSFKYTSLTEQTKTRKKYQQNYILVSINPQFGQRSNILSKNIYFEQGYNIVCRKKKLVCRKILFVCKKNKIGVQKKKNMCARNIIVSRERYCEKKKHRKQKCIVSREGYYEQRIFCKQRNNNVSQIYFFCEQGNIV